MPVNNMTETSQESHRIHLYWTIVNGLVVLFSTILFIDILRAGEDRSERPWAVAEYLLYNFGTSLIWIIEVSMRAYEQSTVHKSLVVEWLLALYFVGDSTKLVVEWKIQEKNDLTENGLEALVGILSYSYMGYLTYNAYQKSTTQFEYVQLSEEPAVTADV